jgi:hypothetical protein
MVRRDNNDYLRSNTSTNRGDYIAPGFSVLGGDGALPRRLSEDGAARRPYLSAEREVCLDARRIRFVDACRFAQTAFPFGAFCRQQMASRRTRPQNLTSCGNLEALGY